MPCSRAGAAFGSPAVEGNGTADQPAAYPHGTRPPPGVSRAATMGTLKSMQQRGLLPTNPGYSKLVDLRIATKVVTQLGRKNFPY